jgi:hypothetical protein
MITQSNQNAPMAMIESGMATNILMAVSVALQ